MVKSTTHSKNIYNNSRIVPVFLEKIVKIIYYSFFFSG